MKDIWIINHYAIPPEWGGLSRHYYFSKYLAQNGYNIKIFSASKIHNSGINVFDHSFKEQGDQSVAPGIVKELNIDGVSYSFIKTPNYKGNSVSRIKNMLIFPVRVLKHCKKFGKPSLIYTSSPSPFAALAAMKLAKKMKIPLILEIRDLWPESIIAYRGDSSTSLLMRCLYALEKFLYKHADALIFTIEGWKDYFKEKNLDKAVDTSKIYYINNGVDLAAYKRSLNITIKDQDLDDESTFKVIYAGSIRQANNLDILLNAAKLIKYKNIKFLVYGEGTERKTLEERCNLENINNVVFKGYVPQSALPYVLSKASANLIIFKPTILMKYGSSFNKTFDYLASGKPIISNLQQNYDLLQRYGCGVSAKGKSPQDLADAIEWVYNLPEERYKQMCENTRSAVEDFDYQKLTEKLIEVIENLSFKQNLA